MAARFASHTSVLRSALAAHASLSASSLLYSAFGNSQLPTDTIGSSQISLQNYNEHTSHVSSISTALPWLDQLHNLIAGMYISGGVNNRCFIRNQQPHTNNVSMIKIGDDIQYENPICSYLGEGELERAFKGRSFLHPTNNVKTILECINVEASQDSIVGASQLSRNQHNIGTQVISSSPPKIYITYQIQQQFGSFFTVNSLLVVTCQVRRCSSERVRKITNEDRLTMPLATSGVVRRSTIQSLAAVGGPISVALAKAKSKIVEAATSNNRKHTDTGGYNLQPSSSPPLVAEVIRIEERWNGVDLLKFAPFHWSRRLNGLVASSAAYFFFFDG